MPKEQRKTGPMRDLLYCFESSYYFRCPGGNPGNYLVLECGHCRWEPGKEAPKAAACYECEPEPGPGR